ncbi:lysozyme inhibitor LprI family protein [Hyphomicrobium facile]|uniref:Lysozyme inhibitor LprI N-terminal domain-containing protein n=1 Tax=Hyphomicrobium facile TaxID=51670 RepID=A0A1I7MTL3_9HYPH|nr:lysozyme inhibitor LprI family protein [Hyphomicrobium facile]SFV25738.1 hypothetical protein SAMN04488557_0077 [Hyphomicrobium facile]
MRWIAPAMMAIAIASASAAANAGDYAPLDCAKAKSPAERTICRDYDLGQSEARMATLFAITTSLVPMGQRGDIQDDQRKWLQSRDACGKNIACLQTSYARRIEKLENVMAGIASRGPY